MLYVKQFQMDIDDITLKEIDEAVGSLRGRR
jgi:hypothetical protein